MNSKMVKKILVPLVVLAASILATTALLNSKPDVAKVDLAQPALLVDIAQARKELISFRVESQGSVSPRTQTTIVAEASGQITEVSPAFVRGGFFRKGDILVRIDPRNYESAVKRARANVARASTQLAQDRALAANAQADYKKFLQSKPKSGPASDLTLRKPQLQQALAELQFAEAELEKALGDLDRTVIRAPYDGLVRQKNADFGQFVSPGTNIGTTFAVDKAEVRLPVSQKDLQYLEVEKLQSGEPIDVVLQAELGGEVFSWSAYISRSEAVFDQTSRVLFLVAEVNDPYNLDSASGSPPLLIGTFVTASVAGRFGGELIKIPRRSIYQGDTVWLVDEDSLIYPSTVNVVQSDERFSYVSSGLEDGDQYCITPINDPIKGMRVRFNG